MNLIKLYLLHFANIKKLYDTNPLNNPRKELASRVPGFATVDNGFLLGILWWVAVVVEPFVSLLFVTLSLPRYTYKLIKRGRKRDVGHSLALCYSDLSKHRVKANLDVFEKIDYYLYPISVDKSWIMEGAESHSVLDSVSFFEVLKAFFVSIPTIIIATINTHGKYLFRTHLCYEYFLTYYFLKRVPADSALYFVNHLDRWAVLFNLAPQHYKVLMQHGIEAPTADWPVKLTNVNKAYVFAESQKERMIKAVLGHELEFAIMPPTIVLKELPDTTVKSVLIVSCQNYMYYDNEEYIIKALADTDYKIFVKIHPGKNDYQKYVDLQNTVNHNVEIITTATFPRVNIVVSYYSTLGIEYEAHNIPVLYYNQHSLDDIVNEIRKD